MRWVLIAFFFQGIVSDKCYRTQLGLALVHLGVDSNSPETRKNVQIMLAASAVKLPTLTNDIVREALTVYLSRPVTAPNALSLSSDDPAPPPVNKQGRLSGLLLSAVALGDDVETEVREDILVQYVDLAHHPLACQLLSLSLSYAFA